MGGKFTYLLTGEQATAQRIQEHLAELDTPRIIVEGREARQLPFSSGDAAAFLRSEDGRIVCRHVRLRASLLHMKAAGHHARCSCMPMGFPMRGATRALSAPEKRNSAAKRKRADETAMRKSQQPRQAANPVRLVELRGDASTGHQLAAVHRDEDAHNCASTNQPPVYSSTDRYPLTMRCGMRRRSPFRFLLTRCLGFPARRVNVSKGSTPIARLCEL